MFHPKDSKERILHRLKISRGHLDSLIKMFEDDKYCIDIIHQSQAIQSALKQVDSLVLENHLNSCVVDKVKEGRTKDAMNEVMDVFKKGY